jgi:hypothetical protein
MRYYERKIMAKLKIEITKDGDFCTVDLLLVKTHSVESLDTCKLSINDVSYHVEILLNETKGLTKMP